MLNIYIRKDLNMRKGKMAAQSAHAAMKLLLESMDFVNNKLILNKDKEKDLLFFFNNPEVNIIYADSEESLKESLNKKYPHSLIVDNGRTEFHGVQTLTCAASGIFSEKNDRELLVPYTYGEEIKAKQIFIYSKEKPLTKENAVKLSVISCLKIIYSLMEKNEIDLTNKSDLSEWINGAFGKIAVSVKKDDDLSILKENLDKNNIKSISYDIEGNKCLVVEPKKPDNIDIFTKSLSLI